MLPLLALLSSLASSYPFPSSPPRQGSHQSWEVHFPESGLRDTISLDFLAGNGDTIVVLEYSKKSPDPIGASAIRWSPDSGYSVLSTNRLCNPEVDGPVQTLCQQMDTVFQRTFAFVSEEATTPFPKTFTTALLGNINDSYRPLRNASPNRAHIPSLATITWQHVLEKGIDTLRTDSGTSHEHWYRLSEGGTWQGSCAGRFDSAVFLGDSLAIRIAYGYYTLVRIPWHNEYVPTFQATLLDTRSSTLAVQPTSKAGSAPRNLVFGTTRDFTAWMATNGVDPTSFRSFDGARRSGQSGSGLGFVRLGNRSVRVTILGGR